MLCPPLSAEERHAFENGILNRFQKFILQGEKTSAFYFYTAERQREIKAKCEEASRRIATAENSVLSASSLWGRAAARVYRALVVPGQRAKLANLEKNPILAKSLPDSFIFARHGSPASMMTLLALGIDPRQIPHSPEVPKKDDPRVILRTVVLWGERRLPQFHRATRSKNKHRGHYLHIPLADTSSGPINRWIAVSAENPEYLHELLYRQPAKHRPEQLKQWYSRSLSKGLAFTDPLAQIMHATKDIREELIIRRTHTFRILTSSDLITPPKMARELAALTCQYIWDERLLLPAAEAPFVVHVDHPDHLLIADVNAFRLELPPD